MLDTWIARAFLYRMLTTNQRERLMHLEINMPPRRYLTGFEICRLFSLQPKAPTEAEIGEMDRVKSEYKKILWKNRILNYRKENPNLTDKEITEVVDSHIDADDRFAWQEFAAVHYRQPSGTFRGDAAPGREFIVVD